VLSFIYNIPLNDFRRHMEKFLKENHMGITYTRYTSIDPIDLIVMMIWLTTLVANPNLLE